MPFFVFVAWKIFTPKAGSESFRSFVFDVKWFELLGLLFVKNADKLHVQLFGARIAKNAFHIAEYVCEWDVFRCEEGQRGARPDVTIFALTS